MHKVIYTLILTVVLISCSDLNKKEWKNLCNQKDYALLEDFILQNPNSIHFEEAIESVRQLKEQKDEESIVTLYPAYYGRNIIRIIIKSDSLLWIGEKYKGKILTSNIDSLALDFIQNKEYSENQPLKTVKEIDGISFEISKGRFLIIYEKDDKLEEMKNIINKLNKSLTIYKKQIQNENGLDDSQYLRELVFESRLEIFEYQKHLETEKQ